MMNGQNAPWTPIAARDAVINTIVVGAGLGGATFDQVFESTHSNANFSWPEQADDMDYIRINWPRFALQWITSLSPTTAVHATAFTLTVNGSGFTSGSKILVNGVALATTTFVNANQITGAILTTTMASAATYTIQVQNQAGFNGNSVNFVAT
jgi:hypothetical protein